MSTANDTRNFQSLHSEFARLLRAEAAGEERYGPFPLDEPAGLAVAHRFAHYMGVGQANVAAIDAFTHWFCGLEDPNAFVTDWRREYKQLRLDQREERMGYLAPYIGRWVRLDRIYPTVKLLGTVALYLVIDERLYEDFIDLFQRTTGLKLASSFRSPADFVAAIRQACGWGSIDPTRINHDLKTAEFWIEIDADGQPTPPNLSRIEDLAYEPDRLQIYRQLVVEADNAVPSYTAIKALVDERRGRSAGTSALGLRLQTKLDVRQAIRELTEPTPNVAAALKILHALDERVTPKPRTWRKKTPRPQAPRYDASLGCPFVLREGDDGDMLLTLAHPIPDNSYGRLWSRACRDRWQPLDGGTDTAVRRWRIPICATNPSQAHAERPAVRAFLAKLCVAMKAPPPTLPDRVGPRRIT